MSPNVAATATATATANVVAFGPPQRSGQPAPRSWPVFLIVLTAPGRPSLFAAAVRVAARDEHEAMGLFANFWLRFAAEATGLSAAGALASAHIRRSDIRAERRCLEIVSAPPSVRARWEAERGGELAAR